MAFGTVNSLAEDTHNPFRYRVVVLVPRENINELRAELLRNEHWAVVHIDGAVENSHLRAIPERTPNRRAS